MEDFKIQKGEPLGRETLLPLPELSYEQELLNTPVPFENRVVFLSEYSKSCSKQTTLDQLVVNLGISKNLARTILDEVDAPVLQMDDGNVVYDLFTQEVIEEELLWEKQFLELDDYLSAIAIARVLSKGADSVHQLANGLGVYPVFVEAGKRKTRLYPKELAHMLRSLSFHFPPGGDWYSPDEAEATIGKEREWIDSRVAIQGLKSAMRMSRNNTMAPHYPLETIQTLKEIADKLPPPAGDWMTVSRMAKLLNKSSSWVELRVSQYSATAEDRLTDIYAVKLHYPPWVLLSLKELVDKLQPPNNGWLTVNEIGKMLMKSKDWVNGRLKEIKAIAEERLDSKNIPQAHYHPSVIDELQLKYLIEEENRKLV